jgi:hypothetical protein
MKQTLNRLSMFMLAFTLTIATMDAQAQVPQKFNYQGIARDAKGNPLSQQRMTLKLTVLPTSDATEGEYEEIQTVTTNEFGLYTLQIGNGSPLKGEMSAVKWETGNKYIKVAIDPKGGSDFLDAGTNQLLSVPYAIYADKAGVAKNSGSTSRATNNFIEKTNGSGVVNSTSQIYDNGTNIGIGTTSPVARVHVNANSASVQEHIRMQNLSPTGAGRFTLYNNNANAFATFTKYGTNYAGGYTGISSLYPYANLLAFGNNDTNGAGNGRFLISTEGNTGISIFKGGTSKLKYHVDYATERVGIGGNAVPAARVHANNTDGTSMELMLSNNTTGHTATDGFMIQQSGSDVNLNNKENGSLSFSTNNSERVSIDSIGRVGLGISSPLVDLHLIEKASFTETGILMNNLLTGYGINNGTRIRQNATEFSIINNSGPVKLGTNLNTRLIIAPSGEIGINTLTPTAQLDVNGQIRMQGGSPGAGKIMTSDATGIGSWTTTSAAGLVSGTGSANSIPKFTGSNSLGNSVMTESGGNIGIGTVTPAAKLDVKTTSNYVAQFNGVTPMYMGLFENDVYRGYIGSYTGNDKDVDFGSGAGTNGKVHLTTNATPRLSVDSAGRVGVGTTSPNHLVHINGGDLFVQSSSGLIRFGYNGSNEWQMATTGAGADLRWYTTPDGGTTITPRHYFQQNGNVGIGGFSGPGLPLGRLDVLGAGSTSSTNTFLLRNSIGDTLLRMRDDGRMGIGYNGTSYGRTMNLGGTGINFYTTNGTAFGGAIFPTDTSLVLWSNSNANNYLVMQPSWGNTGIGTYTPNAKLHLNGAMLIGGNSANPATGYELSVDGDVIAESFVTLNSTSWPDYVFSENYKLMPLNELEQSIKENKHLPKIPPASVMESKGINLGDMTVSLTEKIEELTLYLIELNKKNEELTNRVKQLESQLK